MRIEVTHPGFLTLLPDSPGVYKYYDTHGKLLYVGKAKHLKKRVSSYFNKTHEDAKTRILVRQIHSIELILVDSEMDALLLENNLIKENKPRYNILLKDDKTYPWICLKKEPFPRVFITRTRYANKDEYFGPYPKGRIHRQLLDIIHELYPIRTCSLDLSVEAIERKQYKVCLEYHLKRCDGPCINASLNELYEGYIAEIRMLLKGKTFTLIQALKRQMSEHVSNLAFEQAQVVKTKLEALEGYHAKSVMVNNPKINCDVLTLSQEANLVYYNYLWVREGRVDFSVSDQVTLPINETMDDLAKIIWHQLHMGFNSQEHEIISNIDITNDLPGFHFSKPLRGEKMELVTFSLKNIKHRTNQTEAPKTVVNVRERIAQLQLGLRLPAPPIHIECFDNSNFQGTNAVAACVVFKNGLPSASEYRHFNIKTVVGPDDFASMKEIVHRRYKRMLEEDRDLPDLIVIDGGKGQLSAAIEALESLNLRGNIPVIGLAKKLEEVFFPGDTYPILLDRNNPGLLLLQHIRNEAHRFGITHHRNKRSNSFLVSEFNEIPGIGDKSREKIQMHFPSLKQFKKASIDEQDQKLGKALAKKIRDYLN
ncbi:MAG: excinuclease ABC subunit UvrC [Cryomorphaceae bacterium]|nr:excinuclease ABC subunit UvrC [Cryomorphaceae bacterium]